MNNKPISFGDKASMLLILLGGIYLMINSIVHLFLGERFYILALAAGIGIIYASYRFYDKTISPVQSEASVTKEHLKPVIEEIEISRTEHDEILERLETMNYNLERVASQESKNLSNSSVHHMTMLFRYNLLVTVTLAFYIFMVFFPEWYTFYISLITFILWWALITYHHDLWRKPGAWYWLTIPFLFVPLFVIVFTALYPVTIMFGFLFIGLIVYSFLYYTWCEYAATGIVPFGIGKRINTIKTMLKAKESN